MSQMIWTALTAPAPEIPDAITRASLICTLEVAAAIEVDASDRTFSSTNSEKTTHTNRTGDSFVVSNKRTTGWVLTRYLPLNICYRMNVS